MAKVDMLVYVTMSAEVHKGSLTTLTEMRKDLIKGIKNNPAPVSKITDGATDNTQNHYLVVLLQIIEDN